MLRDYVRLAFFAIGLLVGIQVPSFVDQYHKRVDAHYSEARHAIAGHQETADKHFTGNIKSLIAHYEASDDPVFKDDAVRACKTITFRFGCRFIPSVHVAKT